MTQQDYDNDLVFRSGGKEYARIDGNGEWKTRTTATKLEIRAQDNNEDATEQDYTHPMVPPSELLKQWEDDWHEEREHADVLLVNAYAAGALAGADAELEECCEVLARELICDGKHVATDLRMIRRPKQPSWKEQALKIVKGTPKNSAGLYSHEHVEIIRRALEQLDD